MEPKCGRSFVRSLRSCTTHSSSSNFIIGEEKFFGQLESCQSLFAGYAGKLSQEFIKRFTTLDEFEQVTDRHACPGKTWRATHPLRVHVDNVFDVHKQNL